MLLHHSWLLCLGWEVVDEGGGPAEAAAVEEAAGERLACLRRAGSSISCWEAGSEAAQKRERDRAEA